jgi:hypothetical protein
MSRGYTTVVLPGPTNPTSAPSFRGAFGTPCADARSSNGSREPGSRVGLVNTPSGHACGTLTRAVRQFESSNHTPPGWLLSRRGAGGG